MKRSSSYLPRVYSAPTVCFLDNSCCWCGLHNCRGGGNSIYWPGLNSNSNPGRREVVSTAVIHHYNIGPGVSGMVTATDHAYTPLVTLVTPVTRVHHSGHVSHLMCHVHPMLRDPFPDHNNSSSDPDPAMVAAPIALIISAVTIGPEAGD